MQLLGTLLGPFHINREIGRGGMAIVYHAVDTRNGSDIALKILKPELTTDATSVRRFAQEAKIALRLRHPNIIRTHEVDEMDGIRYMAMEYAEQGTLAAKLKEQRTPLSLAETTHLLRRIGMALDYAHNRGVLHRDVKPNNILLGRNGQSLLSDFGIARHLDDNYTMLTNVSEAIGTPSYMSPEQVHNDRGIDHRSDVYSLGVVAYAMLTGKLPFEASTHVRMLHKIAYEAPLAPEKHNPKLAGGVCYALLRALAKDPASRYQSAVEFVDALIEGDDWQPTKADWATLQAALQESSSANSPNTRSSNTDQQPARGKPNANRGYQQPPVASSQPLSLARPGLGYLGSALIAVVLGLLAVAGWGLLSGGDEQATSTPTVVAINNGASAGSAPVVDTPTLEPATATVAPADSATPTPVPSDTPPPIVAAAEAQATEAPATATDTATPSQNEQTLDSKQSTSTPVPDLPTESPTPVPTATSTSSSTPTPLPTHTATPRPAATNTPRPAASPTPTVGVAAAPPPAPIDNNPGSSAANGAAPPPAPIDNNPGSSAANVTVQLLEPPSHETVSGRRTFFWQASGALAGGQAFELVFYEAGQNAMVSGAGWFGTTTATQMESIDVTAHLQDGAHKWAVLLVETNPYRRIQLISEERDVIVQRPGGGGDGGGQPLPTPTAAENHE